TKPAWSVCRKSLTNFVDKELNCGCLGFPLGFPLFRNSSQAMNKIRSHAEARLRTHLMKRYKVKDRQTGQARFRHADLYGRYGLYKIPAGAGWRSVHASV